MDLKDKHHVSIAHLKQCVDDVASAIAACKRQYQEKLTNLQREYDKVEREYRLVVESDLDIARIRNAEIILYRRGAYEGCGDDNSVMNEAIQWFACSYKPTHYTDLNNVFFGCKNYDRWYHQREDCEYGYSPRHGSIVFAVGLQPEFRNKGLTEQQRSDCIYYLEAMKSGRLKLAKAA